MNYDKVIPTTVPAPVVTPHVSNVNTPEERERNAGYAKTFTYTNGTPFTISVTEREGFSVNIPSNDGAHNRGEFCIYVRYRVGPTVNINSTSLLHAAESELTEELNAISVSIKRERAAINSMRSDGAIVFQLLYRIPIDLLTSYSGCLHISQLGISIATAKADRLIVNPDGELGRTLLDGTIGDLPGLNLRIEINDPECTYGSRYINISDRIYRIDTTCDKTKREGVYIYTSVPEFKPRDKVKLHYEFYEADDSLRLYKTYDDAVHHGNVTLERDKEYERIKHTLRMEVLEGEKLKQDSTQSAAFTKAFLDKLEALEAANKKNNEAFIELQRKHEQDREEERKRYREEENARRKQESEERANARKERIEFIKWLSATATALTTLFVIFQKSSKK